MKVQQTTELIETVIILAILAVAGYLVYKAVKGLNSLGTAIQNIGGSLGSVGNFIQAANPFAPDPETKAAATQLQNGQNTINNENAAEKSALQQNGFDPNSDFIDDPEAVIENNSGLGYYGDPIGTAPNYLQQIQDGTYTLGNP
jgi:hypothetical protein